jgi:2-polyprenyl-3-methyl-5-hydroxy-6-metoxy-1,4-benzoquinol methylase
MVPMQEELLEPIFRKIRIGVVKGYLDKNATFCDVGCGNGVFLKNISSYISKGYGFDKKVNAHTDGNLVFRNAYIDEEIPMDTGSVDYVTLIAVLEHLEKPESVLSECNRILKKDGKILLTTPAPISKPILEFLSYRLNIVSPVEIMDHKHYYSKSELKSMLERCGFKESYIRSFEFGLNNFAAGVKK